MTPIKKKTGCPLLQKAAKRTRETVTLLTTMLVIIKMEAGEKRDNVYSSLGLPPAILSTIMANAEKLKLSAQKTTKIACIKCKLH